MPTKHNTEKVHLHIENYGELGEVFEASNKRVKHALAPYPDLAKKLRISIGYDGDVLEPKLKTAQVLFCWDVKRDNLAERAPGLRWIHAHGAGVNHLMPLDWLPNGVTLTNSRGVHGQRALEYASMAILMLNNRVPEMVTHQRARRWQQCFNSGLEGKTLLVIGVGHIGGDVARWAKSSGLKVLGIRRSGKQHRYVDKMFKPSQLGKLLTKVDFILVSAPHTDETHHLLGRKALCALKPGTGIVNYSRANVIDYDALRERLNKGELSAVLDVFDPEPLPSSSPLWNTPNLIMTPHCSSDDADQYTVRTLDLIFRNMERFIAGKRLMNRVNRKSQY